LKSIMFLGNLENITTIVYSIKIFFISIYTYYAFLKIMNIKKFLELKLIPISLIILIFSFVCGVLKNNYDSLTSILFLILALSTLYSKITKYNFGDILLS